MGHAIYCDRCGTFEKIFEHPHWMTLQTGTETGRGHVSLCPGRAADFKKFMARKLTVPTETSA